MAVLVFLTLAAAVDRDRFRRAREVGSGRVRNRLQLVVRSLADTAADSADRRSSLRRRKEVVADIRAADSSEGEDTLGQGPANRIDSAGIDYIAGYTDCTGRTC